MKVRYSFLVLLILSLVSLSSLAGGAEQKLGGVIVEKIIEIFGEKFLESLFDKDGQAIAYARIDNVASLEAGSVGGFRDLLKLAGLKKTGNRILECIDDVTKDKDGNPSKDYIPSKTNLPKGNCDAYAEAYVDLNLIPADIAITHGYANPVPNSTTEYFAYASAGREVSCKTKIGNEDLCKKILDEFIKNRTRSVEEENSIDIELQVSLAINMKAEPMTTASSSLRISDIPLNAISGDLPSKFLKKLSKVKKDITIQLPNNIYLDLKITLDGFASSASEALSIINNSPVDIDFSNIIVTGSTDTGFNAIGNISFTVPIKMSLIDGFTIKTEVADSGLAAVGDGDDGGGNSIDLIEFKVSPTVKKNTDLKWISGAERQNSGFQVWRAIKNDIGNYEPILLRELGNSKQINPELNESCSTKIQGQLKSNNFNKFPKLISTIGNSTESTCYSFIDTSDLSDGTYYYLLEDIDDNGDSTFHCDQIDAVTIGQGPVIDLESAINYCKEVTGSKN